MTLNVDKKLYGKKSKKKNIDTSIIENFDPSISPDLDNFNVIVNDKPSIPFKKDYWIPSNNDTDVMDKNFKKLIGRSRITSQNIFKNTNNHYLLE
jgi:hypothetical protein